MSITPARIDSAIEGDNLMERIGEFTKSVALQSVASEMTPEMVLTGMTIFLAGIVAAGKMSNRMMAFRLDEMSDLFKRRVN